MAQKLKVFYSPDGEHTKSYYLKSEVDAVLAEKDAEIAELKAKLQNHCTTCPVKEQEEAVLAEKDAEIAELQKQVHDYAQGLYVMQARAEKEARHHKYKRCLAMSECRDAQSRWCYQAACTLHPGVTATLHGKPVMVEPKRLFRSSERLLLASTLWKQRAEKFKEA